MAVMDWIDNTNLDWVIKTWDKYNLDDPINEDREIENIMVDPDKPVEKLLLTVLGIYDYSIWDEVTNLDFSL